MSGEKDSGDNDNLVIIKYSDGREDDELDGGKFKVKHILKQEKESRLYEGRRWIPDDEQVLEGGHTYYVKYAGKAKDTANTQNPSNMDIVSVANELTNFHTALLSATVNKDVLSLDNACFFGTPEWGSKLYVRQAYKDLAAAVDGQRLSLIIGNPGIGKSWFLFFLLHKLLHEGKTVVYQRNTDENWCMFTPTGVTEGPKKELPVSELKKSETWYLIDTDKPGRWRAHTVMVSSPCKEHYKEYMKLPVSTFYMPLWTLKELQNCRQLIYPNIDEDDVTGSFAKWGPVARFVLEKRDEGAQGLLDKAIAAADLDAILRFAGESDAPDEASHKLLHMVVSSNYRTYHVDLASPYVARKVAEELDKRKRDELVTFLKSSNIDDDKVASLRGNLFEGYAHKILRRGGTFAIRNLSTQEESVLELPKTDWCYFASIPDLVGIKKDYYMLPVSKRFCAIDAIIAQSASLLQVTTSLVHKVLADGLIELLRFLPKQEDHKLFFVVPHNLYQNFSMQSYITKSKKLELGKEEETDNQLLASITQYALQIPLYTTGEAATSTILPSIPKKVLPTVTSSDSNLCGAITAKGKTLCTKLKATCPYHGPGATKQKKLKRAVDDDISVDDDIMDVI